MLFHSFASEAHKTSAEGARVTAIFYATIQQPFFIGSIFFLFPHDTVVELNACVAAVAKRFII